VSAVVELAGVSLRRGGVEILADLDWRVERGGHCVLFGANGSGKTTLLKVVAGYEWPSRGTVTVLGERFGCTPLAALRQRLGWVTSAFLQWIPPRESARQTVLSGPRATAGLRHRPSAEEEARAAALLTDLGLGAAADRPFAVLSQGERQRTLIARALMARPQLLILDEPCAGLDLAAREDLLASLERLAAGPDAPTLIHVTHHVEEVSPLFGQALVLRQGRALASGATEATLTGETLSRAFDRPVIVRRQDGRYHASLGSSPHP
jgi:iron complex transport system ATP-binding protein